MSAGEVVALCVVMFLAGVIVGVWALAMAVGGFR